MRLSTSTVHGALKKPEKRQQYRQIDVQPLFTLQAQVQHGQQEGFYPLENVLRSTTTRRRQVLEKNKRDTAETPDDTLINMEQLLGVPKCISPDLMGNEE